ncbi:hypothetical protein PZ895_11245 [Mesorhizobium sp. YIM 152430]|uniref:hypothetical protein n=1 Tax=Mesorhizobium sp. YIM 152430 TaxID=3031761 RepID=UPI0023DA0B56|nr:hypothetical protein [Mesorhizobium sp. YIM 152430]MDF1600335.1 hypothetical protein [Mesorhizobium sp. YIM 152430]
MAQAAENLTQSSAEQAVRDLARRHQITASRSQIDDWADDVTRLAGDDVTLDEVEELIVGLRRKGVVDGAELTRLHSRYLEERNEPNV